MLVSSSCSTPQAMVRNWAKPQAVSGVQYVEAMKALVIYVYVGELFLFDAAGYREKMGEPAKPISVSYTHLTLPTILRV